MGIVGSLDSDFLIEGGSQSIHRFMPSWFLSPLASVASLRA
jgi:hypothetical protein